MSSLARVMRLLALVGLSASLVAGCPGTDRQGRPDAGPDAGGSVAQRPAARRMPPGSTMESDRFQVPIDGSPQAGSDQALVTAVLFGDLTDPATARIFTWLRERVDARPGELRWVFKHFPSVRPGDTGLRAAKAAAWAAAGGRFEAFAGALLSSPGPVDEDRAAAAARSAGLAVKGLAEALADSGIEQRVQADRRLAARLGVRTAPGLFLNGRRVGVQADALAAAFARELGEARALVERGTPPGKVYAQLTRNGRRSAWMKIRAPNRPVPIDAKREAVARSPDDLQTVMVPPGHGPRLGPAGAPVELVVFVELGCSLCARVIPLVEKLHKNHPRDLRVSFRVLPDRRKRRPLLDAAIGLLAVADQPESVALLAAALEGQQDRRALATAAGRLGMDPAALQAGWAKPDVYLAQLDRNRAAADRAGVRGSPYLFVNGRPIPGLTNIERVERMITDELARTEGR